MTTNDDEDHEKSLARWSNDPPTSTDGISAESATESPIDLYQRDWAIAEAMIVYGGSFVHGLGRLFHQADFENKARLKAAFPEYWARYRELAALSLANAEGRS